MFMVFVSKFNEIIFKKYYEKPKALDLLLISIIAWTFLGQTLRFRSEVLQLDFGLKNNFDGADTNIVDLLPLFPVSSWYISGFPGS